MKITIPEYRARQLLSLDKGRKPVEKEISISQLNNREISLLKNFPKNKCMLLVGQKKYYLSNLGDEVKEREDYFEDSTEEQKIIFTTIEEAFKKSKKLFKNIEAVVDILQESNNPYADNFVALYEILKALETIQKYRNKIKQKFMPKSCTYSNAGREMFYYDECGIVKSVIKDLEEKVNLISLKDVSIESLLGVLCKLLDVPQQTVITGNRY